MTLLCTRVRVGVKLRRDAIQKTAQTERNSETSTLRSLVTHVEDQPGSAFVERWPWTAGYHEPFQGVALLLGADGDPVNSVMPFSSFQSGGLLGQRVSSLVF